MKAKYITYGELQSGPGFNNKRVEITNDTQTNDQNFIDLPHFEII